MINFQHFGNISTDSERPDHIFFLKTGLIYAFILTKKFKNQQNIQFFWWFLVPKIVFWKNHYWVGTTTDCFDPIFGFLGTFCFEKHRSASWNMIGMFSELSGHSDYINTWARISSRKLLNCTHCIVEFECVSAQLYLVDDSQLQWRENISEKWTKKTSRIVKKCSIHECIFWFVPNPQGKDFDKSNQTSAWNLPNFDQEIQCTERILFFSITPSKVG